MFQEEEEEEEEEVGVVSESRERVEQSGKMVDERDKKKGGKNVEKKGKEGKMK